MCNYIALNCLKQFYFCEKSKTYRKHFTSLACFKWLSKGITPKSQVYVSECQHPHIIHQLFDNTHSMLLALAFHYRTAWAHIHHSSQPHPPRKYTGNDITMEQLFRH